MARSAKSILLAGVLVAAAGSAYASDPQQPPQTNQLSYAAPQAPAPTVHRWEHYEAPPGYYQDPRMVPYSKPGYGPKPN
jgi:nitrate reductase cytochrome c-type subunit